MRGIGSDDCVKTGWGRRSFLESLLVAPFTQSSPTLIHSLACDDALDGSPLAWIKGSGWINSGLWTEKVGDSIKVKEIRKRIPDLSP